MKRYDGILLCSDFDLTLTSDTYKYRDGDDFFASIPKNNIAAVNEFVNNGGTFAVVSGRNPDEIALLKDVMPIADLCVCSNGTAVYSVAEMRPVVSFTMGRECEPVIEYFSAIADEYAYLRVTDGDFRFNFYRGGDDVAEFVQKPKFPVYKMIIEHTDKALGEKHYEAARERFGDKFSVEMSSWRTLEVCPNGSGKGEALKRLIPLLGKKFDKVVCVGDNQNDIGMIKLADVGYAVGNAIPALKRVATRVTVNSREGAIAKIIEEL